MVPIYNMQDQGFQHVYISIISDYIETVDIFLGLSGSRILNVCAKFVTSVNFIYFFVFFEILIDTVGHTHWCSVMNQLRINCSLNLEPC